MINFKETSMPLPNKDNREKFKNQKLRFVCEACGQKMIMTPAEGYKAGWDYPPYMYPFSVISPRTCNKCGIEKTVWWEICMKHKTFEELTDSQKETIERIYREPESIIVKDKYK
ncbi:hypothetical protein PRVXH_002298 [Proteinivorax hydrogeniformans]|uniref:Uncharacterized protein n=1 Tax=Proteinivorax hydrogeniformans TaxID=1826727 RepID=A0AAU8HRZ6_9FIRM